MKTMDVDAIPVRVVKTPEDLSELAVEFGAPSTWTIPQIGTQQPVQILQRRPSRSKAQIWIPAPPNSGGSVSAQGTVAAPAAFTPIATTATLPPGTYTVSGSVTLGGTLTAGTDNGNVRLVANGAAFATLPVPAVDGTYPYGPITFTIGPASSTVILQSGANAATAGSTYGGGLTVTPLNNSGVTAVALSHRQDYLANANNPQGLIFPVSILPLKVDWESQQPCYAAAVGTAGATVLTLDQAQAAAQAVAEESVQVFDYGNESDQQEGGVYGRVSETANDY